MAPVASPLSVQDAAPRGLWPALVEAAAADQVIDLAAHAQAHIGYLERVAAGVPHAPITAVVPDGSADLATTGTGVVIDLAQHRSRRSLTA